MATPLLPSIPIETAASSLDQACIDNLHRLFPNSLSSARALGDACRACGQEASAAALLAELCHTPDERTLLATGSLDEIRRWLDVRIRSDFAAGRTKRVDGWVLSATEALVFTAVATS